MLVLTWLVVFAVVGFSLVNTIPRPRPTLNRISRSKSSPEEQIVIGKASRINLPTSRLLNWYHDSCTFTGDISTQKSATCNEDLRKSDPPYSALMNAHTTDLPCKASLSPSAVAADQARSQSNRPLFQERQACFPVCGSATMFPYDTFCCEEGQYCTTINRTPLCYWSTSVQSQAFSSPTSSTLTTTVTTPISTSQFSSAASATQTSIKPGPTSDASKTNVTTASSTTQTSELASSHTTGSTTTYSPTPTASSAPPSSTPSVAAGAGSGLDLGTIVGIVFGVVGAIGVVAAIIFGVRQWNQRYPGDRAVRDVGSWFCGCGRSHHHDEILMGRYPRQNRYH